MGANKTATKTVKAKAVSTLNRMNVRKLAVHMGTYAKQVGADLRVCSHFVYVNKEIIAISNANKAQLVEITQELYKA